ncbi:MAG: STN domain-containing protein [Gemmataceae bacterium]|nr:STN domain-containing protein [Gemmataceae bacterium]
MIRTSWLAALGAVLALGGAIRAHKNPCTPPGNPAPGTYRSQTEQMIERKLAMPVSLNFKECPLGQVIEDLSNITGINVVADTDALREAAVNLEQPLSLRVEDISLQSALNILLKKAALTYVIKDGALQITTACPQPRLKTVTYPVADLVVPIGSGESELPPFLCRKFPELAGKHTPGQTGETVLINLITSIVERSSWCDVGGNGTIQFFPFGLALVVNQTQDIQEQIADLLAALRGLQEREDKDYQLEAKLVEVSPDGLHKERSWPKVTFVRGQRIHIRAGTTVMVNEGSVRDLLPCGPSALGRAEYRATGFIKAFRPDGFFSGPTPQGRSPRIANRVG